MTLQRTTTVFIGLKKVEFKLKACCSPNSKLMIEHGADLNAKDLNGKTPMHHTSFHKAKAVAKLLQSYDAS